MAALSSQYSFTGRDIGNCSSSRVIFSYNLTCSFFHGSIFSFNATPCHYTLFFASPHNWIAPHKNIISRYRLSVTDPIQTFPTNFDMELQHFFIMLIHSVYLLVGFFATWLYIYIYIYIYSALSGSTYICWSEFLHILFNKHGLETFSFAIAFCYTPWTLFFYLYCCKHLEIHWQRSEKLDVLLFFFKQFPW